MVKDSQIWSRAELTPESISKVRKWSVVPIVGGSLMIGMDKILDVSPLGNTLADIVGTFYLATGLGDLVTGKHHYTTLKTYYLVKEKLQGGLSLYVHSYLF
jgi:hypothetical protein